MLGGRHARKRPPALVHVPVTRPLRPGSARAAVAELVRLFPRGLFEDALPPIALRSQVYSLVPDRTAADRQLVRGVGATDRSSTQALVPPAILPFSKPSSFWARHCSARENATDPVKGRAGSREHDISWKWKSEASVETESLGVVGACSAGSAGRRQITTGLGHQCCFCFTPKTMSLEHVKQERERCVAWFGGSEMRQGDQFEETVSENW